jgi:N-acetylmuramoyl-L-alanine amidase
MKYAIDLGHNVGADGGAVGIHRENDLIMQVGEKVIYRLRNTGHQVVECKPTWASSVNDSLNRRVRTANTSGADVAVSIHFNAFSDSRANGTEVFAISSKGQHYAKKVVNNIAALGFTNRGVKHRPFYFLRATSMPAILVECCFCTSQRDMNLFNADKMAAAIANGLMS